MRIVGIAGFPDIEHAFVMLELDLEVLDRGSIVAKLFKSGVDAPGRMVIANRGIETGGVEPPDVFEPDPAAAFSYRSTGM